MPAYEAGKCNDKWCLGLLMNIGAQMGADGMGLADIFARLAQMELAQQDTGKGAGTVVAANGGDPFPGVLEQKLEAGDNITLTVQAPAGAAGRAADERVVRISSTGVDTSGASTYMVYQITAPDTAGFDWTRAANI